MLLSLTGAIVLIYLGLADTLEAAWKRHYQHMRARGITPERTGEWEKQFVTNRFVLLAAGIIWLVITVVVAYIQARRFL